MRKNMKLLSMSALSTLAVVAPISTVVSCSSNMSVGFNVAFFNYKDYVSDDAKDMLSKEFNYKEFGDLPEFSQQLQAHKTIGGVGSDYYNAKLALGGYIKPINFKKALHINYNTRAELKTILKDKAYTTEAWNQMSYFDSLLADAKLDANNDGVLDELWEYMIPYYMQNKVLAFNVNRGNWTANEKAKLADPTKINEVFTDRTYVGLLKTLKAHNYTNFLINDYLRDNMIIGSETNGDLTGNVKDLSDAKSMLSGFAKTFKDGYDVDIFKDKTRVKFESSGAESLGGIIDPEKKWQASFIYNGDALDAYYSSDNFDGLTDGADVRYVRPENPTFLLDGVVLAKDISQEYEDKFYESVYSSLFEGWSGHDGEDFSAPSIDYKYDDEDGITSPMVANNFDFVNYTIPFKDVYKRLTTKPNGNAGIGDDYYFGGEDESGNFVDDPLAASIFEIAPNQDVNHVAFPLSDLLEANLNEYYNSLKRG